MDILFCKYFKEIVYILSRPVDIVYKINKNDTINKKFFYRTFFTAICRAITRVAYYCSIITAYKAAKYI